MLEQGKQNAIKLQNGAEIRNDEQLKQQLLSSLSKEDKEKLVKLLSNRQAVDEILKTPQAQELIRKYGKK